MKKIFLKSFCARCLTLLVLALLSTNLAWGEETHTGTFTKITSENDLTTGYYVITASSSATSNSNFALGSSANSNKRIEGVQVTINNGTITNPSTTIVYLITNNTSGYSFKNESTGKYMYQSATTSGKGMGFQDSEINMTLAGYNSTSPIGFRFTLNGTSTNYFKYNTSNKWFANYANDYTTSMTPVELYKLDKAPEGSHTISTVVTPENAGSIELGSATVAEGETTTATATANDHFTFTGWSISGAGSSLSSTIENPTTITMGTEDATITANFEEDAKYNVAFNANGGSGEMDAVSVYAGDYTLPECDFTKTGYKFIGWKANNTGELIVVGSSYTITNTAVEFYAQWKETNEVTYDFKKIPLFSKWGNSYLEHAIQYEQADVIFKSANKNTSTILDQPVTKGGDVEIKAVDGRTISSVALTCKQWSSKAQKITLNYSSDGGKNYSPMTPDVISENFSVETTTLPKNTNAVKFTFSSSDNQIGITSAVLEFSEPTINKTSVTVSDKNFATANFRRNVVVPTANTVYLVSNVDENKVTLLGLDEGDICEAGLGLLVYQQGGGNVEFACTSETADWTKEFLKDETRLVGMPETGATLENDYGGTTNYILSVDTNDKFGFCTPKDNKFITSAGKAYLAVVGSSSAKSLEISFNDVTGIKTIDNSQLTIDNSKAYNLNGLRVNENYKGIIIVNGRKYINK